MVAAGSASRNEIDLHREPDREGERRRRWNESGPRTFLDTPPPRCYGPPLMAELGTKHECVECDTKFYDLGKDEPICPNCGTNQREYLEAKKAEEEAAERAAAEEAAAEAKELEEADEELPEEQEDEGEDEKESDD